MMYWLGLVLFAYLLVALFILGSVISRKHVNGDFSMTERIAVMMFCSLLWPVALYQGKLKITMFK